MISKETYRHLLNAGTELIKSTIAIDKKYSYNGIKGVNPYEAFNHILNAIPGILDLPQLGDYLLSIYYVDTVSLFVRENEYAEEYFEKMFAILDTVDEDGNVPKDVMKEFMEMVEKVPDDEQYWIRRNF